MKDYKVAPPPEDSVSSMAFSPACMTQNLLVAGSWDNNVRCWEVESSGKTIPKSMQSMRGPVLDVCWQDDGTKVYMGGSDCSVKCWDLATNRSVPVAQHDAPIKTCHWIKGSSYSCLMTGSWDKSLKFWDIRSPQPIRTFCLPERCYCADVVYPMAVVGTADKKVIIYQLDGGPQEYMRLDSALKFQIRCVAIFKSKEGSPEGFAAGGVEGKVVVQYLQKPNCNFTFRCHRSDPTTGCQDIYAVNGIAFHPFQSTLLVTVGSDGRFMFWDKDTRTKILVSEFMEMSITTCAISNNGQIFAYSVCYDWSKGHEFNDSIKKNNIYLRPMF